VGEPVVGDPVPEPVPKGVDDRLTVPEGEGVAEGLASGGRGRRAGGDT
jgi:hypothetical protein